MTNKLDRAKIAKMVKDSDPTEQFNPAINDVVFWYDNLNEHLFDGDLPRLTGVQFKKTKDYWGEMTCHRYKRGDKSIRAEVKLSYSFTSFKDFLEVIAHEMVHLWEYKTYGVMGHGERFFSWETKLKQLGLGISEKK